MTDINRRKFNKLLGTGIVAVPLAGLMGTLPSQAADKPLLDPSSAKAKALEYMSVSDKDGKACGTCTLYQGDAGSESGGCPLFNENVVSSKAWCNAWVPKA